MISRVSVYNPTERPLTIQSPKQIQENHNLRQQKSTQSLVLCERSLKSSHIDPRSDQKSQRKTLKHNFMANLPNANTSPTKRHKFQTNSANLTAGKISYAINPHSQMYQMNEQLNNRKNTSSESTVSDKVSNNQDLTKNTSPFAVISPPLTARGLIPNNFNTNTMFSYQEFRTQDNINNNKQKNDIRDFKEQLDDKLQKIQFYIEKAEEAQSQRQRSNSITNRQQRRNTKSPVKQEDIRSIRQQTKGKGIVSMDLIQRKVLNEKTQQQSSQSSFTSINFNSDHKDNKMPNYNHRFSEVTKQTNFRDERIDTIEENEYSRSDNEEENKILEILTNNNSSQNNKSNNRSNERYLQPHHKHSNSHSSTQQINLPLQRLNPEIQTKTSTKNDLQKLYQDLKQKHFATTQNQEPPQLKQQFTETIKQQSQPLDYYQELLQLEQKVDELNKINHSIIDENKKLSHKCKNVQKKYINLKCKYKLQETQFKQQTELFQVQNQRIEMINNERFKLINNFQVQEDQIKNLKNLLNQSLETKIKYENIFKKLLDNENCRNYVLELLKV